MHSLKVVIIDDSPVDLYYLANVFQHRRCQVQSYADPVLTPMYQSNGCPCSLKSTGCPDLIVSDYNMPVVNGVELLETIFKKGCHCRHFAIISGQGLMDIEEKMTRIAKHGTRFFAKPLDLDDFYDWLDRVEQQVFEGHPAEQSPVFIPAPP